MILVTLDDFVRTYNDGRNIFDKYYSAQRSNEDLKSTASRIGRIPETTIRYWKRGQTPPVVKATDQFEKKGLLPLTTDAELFPALNRLASYVYWTGHLRHEKEFSKYNCSIHGRHIEGNLEQIQDDIKSLFNIESKIRQVYSGNRKELILGSGSAPYSRLFKLMGLPTNGNYGTRNSLRGAFSYHALPNYIYEISDLIEQGHKYLLHLLRDWLAIMFTNKANFNYKRIRLHLHTFKNVNDATKYEEEIKKIIYLVSPWLDEGIILNSTTSKKKNCFEAGLRLSCANTIEFERKELELYNSCFVSVRINKVGTSKG